MIHAARAIQRLIRRAMRPAVPRGPLTSVPPIDRLPASHIEAAARLVEPLTVASLPFKRRKLRASIEGVHPLMLEFARALLQELDKRNMPFFANQYVRSQSEQEALYQKGVTKARWPKSAHNHGMAVDIVHYGRFWDLTQKEWAVIGLIGKEVARKRGLKVTWGGDWDFYDPAHWELSDWKQRINNPGYGL